MNQKACDKTNETHPVKRLLKNSSKRDFISRQYFSKQKITWIKYVDITPI